MAPCVDDDNEERENVHGTEPKRPGKPTYVLGINAYDHDVSACLLRNGEIAFAICKERITREKHATGFYQEVVEYCLAAEGITLGDVDHVVRNCYVLPIEDLEARLAYEDVPEFLDTDERIAAARHPLFRAPSADRIVTLSHHLAHAYSAFAPSPFEEGAVMVVDGVGNYACDVREPGQLTEGVNPLARESESYYSFKGSELKPLKKVWLEPTRGFLSDEFFFMPGLGALYSRVSSYIFADWNKCGEVMGLAPYGRAGSLPSLMQIENGELQVPEWTAAFDKLWLADMDEDWERSTRKPHWEDMAWRVQNDTEEVLLARARWLRETTGARNLCIAGGVGLNCVANGRLEREAGFDNVWIQPAAGDDGIAIGCAYYGQLALQKASRPAAMLHANLGRSYKQADLDTALAGPLARIETRARVADDVCEEAAKLLADGNVLGWFQGRSEFGPRALGNRSIIADPRTAAMKDKLNSRVKHRQAFRPFAPIVIAERAAEIFEDANESPFMLVAKRVRPEWRERIPAIVHVDGTARLQTVRRESNERLYRLLEAFERLTGVPVLLNTSFNVKGEPIVETPQNAVDCFLSTGIDHLVVFDTIVSKNALHGMLSPVVGMYTEMAAMVRKGLEVD